MIYAGVEELKEQFFEELERKRTEVETKSAEVETKSAELDRARATVLAEGGSSLIRRQARLKFGAGTADELSRLVAGIDDPERIARIGDLIIECQTGEELLARAREDLRE